MTFLLMYEMCTSDYQEKAIKEEVMEIKERECRKEGGV